MKAQRHVSNRCTQDLLIDMSSIATQVEQWLIHGDKVSELWDELDDANRKPRDGQLHRCARNRLEREQASRMGVRVVAHYLEFRHYRSGMKHPGRDGITAIAY